jgi:hypothetical protein
MYSAHDDLALPRPGCPIRKPSDQSLLSGSPKHIAASHVLHRLLAPRHPPCALSSLTMLATIHPANGWVNRRNTQAELPCACSLELPFELSKTVASRVCDSRTAAVRSPIVPPRHVRASQCHHGADGDRTHDLRLAKPALSQLSYSPACPSDGDDGPR